MRDSLAIPRFIERGAAARAGCLNASGKAPNGPNTQVFTRLTNRYQFREATRVGVAVMRNFKSFGKTQGFAVVHAVAQNLSSHPTLYL